MGEKQNQPFGRSEFQNLPSWWLDPDPYSPQMCRIDDEFDNGTSGLFRSTPMVPSGRIPPDHSVGAPHATDKTLVAKGKTGNRDPRLTVTQGQVTFDAEGNDVPKSSFFSRHVHWPGNAKSGVTLGRGYDMGGRTQAAVKADLVDAGMSSDDADKFKLGAGLTGPDAKKFVAENRDDLGEISHDVQRQLFENIYPTYIEAARKNYNRWTKDEKDRVAWDKLHPAIRDIMVDFVYQGFVKANPMKQGMRNDFKTLIEYIETNATMKSYEKGRLRADYLRAAAPADSL